MSRATRQAIALLSTAWGALHSIDPTPGTEHTLAYAQDMAERAVIKYPVSGDTKKERAWVLERHRQWKGNGNMPSYAPFALAAMALDICDELLAVVRDPAKRGLIEPLREAVETLCGEYADQDEEEGEHYREAVMLVENMKQVLEVA